ncbi:hypothetical protein HPB48_023354 [Haemaphysalis longicornis]|uniref:Uncharacterized protein n=1 Tax=Haemaphysalis longicornis TaxID=44386 RepID=A0A9J6H7B9_HAELO|nr:hypothetical protein HPB48_023354 [Haemaphysalis longicornis]
MFPEKIVWERRADEEKDAVRGTRSVCALERDEGLRACLGLENQTSLGTGSDAPRHHAIFLGPLGDGVILRTHRPRFHPWLPRAPRHRPPTLRTVATWTVVEADRSVGWVVPPPLGNSSPVLNVAIPRPISQSLSGAVYSRIDIPRNLHPSIRQRSSVAFALTAGCRKSMCPRTWQVLCTVTCMTAAIAAASASAGPRTEDSVAAAFALLLHHRPDLLRDPLPADHVIDMPDES